MLEVGADAAFSLQDASRLSWQAISRGADARSRAMPPVRDPRLPCAVGSPPCCLARAKPGPAVADEGLS